MSFLKKLFRKTIVDPFDEAPFLFPWYVHDNTPSLVWKNALLNWKYIEKVSDEEYVGITKLCSGNKVLGFFRIYDYLFASPNGDKFCVWRQSSDPPESAGLLRIDVFRSANLLPFDSVDETILKFHADKDCPYLLNCSPTASVTIPLNLRQLRVEIGFPDDLRTFNNFIAVATMKLPDTEGPEDRTALIEIRPYENVALIHPQDWFNQDDSIDFGYQWITRAFRNKSTGRIQGQGIRIDPFELDDTDRQLTPSSKASRLW